MRQRIDEVSQRGLRLAHHQGGKDRGHLIPPCLQTQRAVSRLARHQRRDRRQPDAGPWSAQRHIERADIIEPGRPRLPAKPAPRPHQRMRQRRDQWHGRRAFGQDLRQQQEQPPRRRHWQRLAGGIIGLDPPAPQMRHHAGRQGSVWRHQRHALFGLFQHLADQDRDGLRLMARMVGLHQPHGGEAALAFGQVDPDGAGSGRQKQV